MNIAVVGGGSWGTALAHLLACNGNKVRLLLRDAALAEQINSCHENIRYLAGLPLNKGVLAVTDDATALQDAGLLLMVVPCQAFRAVLRRLRPLLPQNPIIVCANKGIEVDSGCTVSQVVAEEMESTPHRFAMLSGPSFAAELMNGQPTAVSIGCEDDALGKELRELFSSQVFRAYSCRDVRGVELGGAVKNVIAIAAGLSDGLGFGHNARAALITRGLAEMSRLGVAMGAQASTFMGLSGMGDLVLTCTGSLSRNRTLGLELASGRSLQDIVGNMNQVAEGVKTTDALHRLGKKLGEDLPITNAMYRVLYEGKNPLEAVGELMARDLRRE